MRFWIIYILSEFRFLGDCCSKFLFVSKPWCLTYLLSNPSLSPHHHWKAYYGPVKRSVSKQLFNTRLQHFLQKLNIVYPSLSVIFFFQNLMLISLHLLDQLKILWNTESWKHYILYEQCLLKTYIQIFSGLSADYN